MPDMRQPEAGSADACAHVLFERHADTHPDAPAVEHDDGRLTYRELDALGNRLAHHLRNLGIGPGDRVGICVERSPDFVTGVLGTLKAGGIYVPLDPEYPVARLSSMAADAGVDVLLLQERTLGRVADAGAREVVLDRERDRLAALPDTRLPCRADVDGPAYVTYTSGSTGRPKGVMPSHRSIIRLVRDTNYISLGPGDRVAQASSCTFDPITFEVWGALLNGACLAIVPRAAMFDADELAAALRRLRVTSMFLTTAAFYAMLRKRPDAFASLRDLLIGGEALETRWVKEILAAGPPRRLVNVYGPTETTTFATWFEVGAAPEGEATLPIGHAVTGAELLVLGEGMAEVPPGGEGELYIGGAGLAIGSTGCLRCSPHSTGRSSSSAPTNYATSSPRS
ncbi:AMP-binding protein, partial [Nonomuraea sp. NPDC055795]